MSVNTSIKEGGKHFPFGPVKALMVQGSDGKYYAWVPESERQLGYKSIDKNGVYQAKKDGVYGWSSVSVNVPTTGSVTGKDPATGQEVTVTTNPETGELVETVVPARIEVTTPPTKTEYTDGETIDYSGMVATAFYKDGTEYGIIPSANLILPDDTALIEKSVYSDGGATVNDTSVLYDPNFTPLPINISAQKLRYYNRNPSYNKLITAIDLLSYQAAVGEVSDSPRSFGIVAYSKNKDIDYRVYNIVNGKITGYGDYTDMGIQLKTKKGEIIYYCPLIYNRVSGLDEIFIFDGYNIYYYLTNLDSEGLKVLADIGEIVLNGIIVPSGYNQNIPVQWQRPGDGAILETTFNITVTGDD